MPSKTRGVKRNIHDTSFLWVSKCILLDGYAKKVGGLGIAIYCVLSTCANKHETCFPTEEYISRILGCSRNTVAKYIKKLRKHGLITIRKRTRRSNVYVLLKVTCPKNEHRQVKRRIINAQNFSTNDTMNEINKRKIELGESSLGRKRDEIGVALEYQRIIRENKLAFDLSETLNDKEGFLFYQSVAEKFAEDFLRKTLAHVMKINDRHIKVSRAALFNYLVTKHGIQHTKNNRD